jgi:hypothetical protein
LVGFSVYLAWDYYDETKGAGAEKIKYWNEWKAEREKRVGGGHH